MTKKDAVEKKNVKDAAGKSDAKASDGKSEALKLAMAQITKQFGELRRFRSKVGRRRLLMQSMLWIQLMRRRLEWIRRIC